jgi:hypothetical protein
MQLKDCTQLILSPDFLPALLNGAGINTKTNPGEELKILNGTGNQLQVAMKPLAIFLHSGLYRYAFNDILKAKYKTAIIDHWKAEKPEKEGLWNIITAIINPGSFGLEDAIWYLQEYPLDLIDWSVKNSHRKDIELIQPNFRGQTIREVS